MRLHGKQIEIIANTLLLVVRASSCKFISTACICAGLRDRPRIQLSAWQTT
jgi:hypothetical protein